MEKDPRNNYKNLKKYIKDSLTLKKAPTISYNQKIYNKAKTTQIDIEKAHYEAELLLDEEDNSEELKKKSMFERKHISIFKFYCHLFEPLDYLFLILGLIGLIIYGSSHTILPYLNANVYSNLGDTSESRENSVVEEIMKQNVREVMNSNIKKQLIYGSVVLVGNAMGYFFLGLISSRCLYNFKKNILQYFYLKNKHGLIQLMFLNLQLKYKLK